MVVVLLTPHAACSDLPFYTVVTKGQNVNAMIPSIIDLHPKASSQELLHFFSQIQ